MSLGSVCPTSTVNASISLTRLAPEILGGDDEEDDDDESVSVVLNETLRCSAVVVLSTTATTFFLFGVAVTAVDDLMS